MHLKVQNHHRRSLAAWVLALGLATFTAQHLTQHAFTNLGLKSNTQKGQARRHAPDAWRLTATPDGVNMAEPITSEKQSTSSTQIEANASNLDRALMLPQEQRPGYTDAAAFADGASVQFWKTFRAGEQEDIIEKIDFSGIGAAYWLYHFGRFGFFAVQGFTSLSLNAVANRLNKSSSSSAPPSFIKQASDAPLEFLAGRFQEAVAMFAQDLDFIKAGVYKAPYDMSPRHKQWSPTFVAADSLRYLKEAVGTLQRNAAKADTQTWLGSQNEIYPDYYRHTFHYQRDGWLSSASARVYESSTETLFLGRQDAMQRSTLVHLSRVLKDGSKANPPRILEIACGTGRLMTFIRDNWPTVDATLSDLSPFYLEKARQNNEYWERKFADSTTKSRAVKYVQANAESLPFEDESFDVVVSVYLFHELPASAQDAVVAEVARVLAPGGTFILTDSIQLGDRPPQDETMDRFSGFAEPHYSEYISRDLAKMCGSCGLAAQAKEIASTTKSLSFTKTDNAELRP